MIDIGVIDRCTFFLTILFSTSHSISKSICEKNKDYETHLNNVLELR